MAKTTQQKPPVILKSKDEPESTEVIAKAIIEVAESAKKLLNSKLKMRAVLILIKDASGGNLSLSDIESVLRHASELDKKYIK